MKTFYVILYSIAVVLLSSFAPNEACSYAGSNMSYVKARTEEALSLNDINRARFYTYKAIRVIQTSTDEFNNCGCEDAQVNIAESLINLKAATKATSLNGTKILLQEALQQISDALDDLDQHEMHDKEFSTRETESNNENETKLIINQADLHRQIDISLESYEESLNRVVEIVNCDEARAFANTVFVRCEERLLKSNLSESKKYYNLRTKEITEKALSRIGDCISK